MDQTIKKKLARNWFKTLQEVICQEIEELEAKKISSKLKIGKEVKTQMKVGANLEF